jgi:hypothetical protein
MTRMLENYFCKSVGMDFVILLYRLLSVSVRVFQVFRGQTVLGKTAVE